MKRIIPSHTLFILGLATLAPAIAAAAPMPPLPDFNKRTNFVEWYEEAFDVPEKDNAYPLYAEFMPGLVGGDVKDDDWPEFVGMLTSPAAAGAMESEENAGVGRQVSPWFPSRKGSWEVSFDRTKGVLKKFAAAARKKYVVAPPSINGGIDDNRNRFDRFTLVHVNRIRQCAQGTLEAAWRINGYGDMEPARFIAAVETNLRVAGQLRTAPFSVEQLTGFAIRRLTYQHIRWAFAHGMLRGDDAEKLLSLLRKVDAKPLDASPCLGTEAAMILDNLQYIFGPLGGGGVKLNGNRYRDVTGQAMGGGNRFGLGARVEADPQGTAAAVLAAYEAIDKQMSPGYSTDANNAISEIGRGLAQKNNLTKGMLYGMEGTYVRLYNLAAQCEADRRATQVLTAVFAHKPGKKKYSIPKKLSDLDKKLVGKAIKDPFSGKPFRYVVTDGKPALYSVGPDGEDDGGSHDADWASATDFVFWPIPDSEETIIASRLNRVKKKKLTPLTQIGPKEKGKKITVSAEIAVISSRPSKKHGQRHSILLKDGKTEVKLYYYQNVAEQMTPRQNLVEGRRIRAVATVVQEDGKWRLELSDARDLALEE